MQFVDKIRDFLWLGPTYLKKLCWDLDKKGWETLGIGHWQVGKKGKHLYNLESGYTIFDKN